MLFGTSGGDKGSNTKNTSRAGRAECYTARDTFYQCVRECGLLYSASEPVPSKCKQLRARFEAACLPSWVRHFDEQQEKAARDTKRLHAAIQQQAATAAGNLAGAAQR
ncbi:hypothetical protein Rsub_01117 [Raphidocelis subcapitata]|uniref:Uncharacterized protein n=1 Tax=Raphidocelis subcapitata TaxID=307507 RepID=A0A2V0NUA2_9CHLO|nr:hypothetical protein Rsub_01117 [Raphidocelis subcapitata]|eukprot:GBF88405.1 hypothetical protein Rsub_01117 [Raphidocelis subcapitata]